jgi:S-adenosylmethionine:tRNA ribosyltransferase-isomerase
MTMKMSEFKYNLPRELIAQYPPQKRGSSNLLVLDRKSGEISHKKYFNIPDFVQEGDVIVLNETKVLNCKHSF